MRSMPRLLAAAAALLALARGYAAVTVSTDAGDVGSLSWADGKPAYGWCTASGELKYEQAADAAGAAWSANTTSIATDW